MRARHTLQVILAIAALTSGKLFAFQFLASATPVPHSIASEQKQLELQLANWAALLGRFGTDVVNSSTLTSAHSLELDARSTGAAERLDALVASAPIDTTRAQLNAAKTAASELNQTFAVLTPQVCETIEADAISSQISTFISNEQPLQSLVSAIASQRGYENAHDHFLNLVRLVSLAQHDVSGVATAVLAQNAANFPGDAYVFVHSNQELSNAGVALVHATNDESVIGLATGGYTGS